MDAKEIKEYRQRHNLTQRQLANIAKCSLRTVQYWEKGVTKVPGPASEFLKLYEKNNHSHNDVTYNTKNNNGGDNIYINNTGGSISNSGNTTGQDKDMTGQCNEIKEMTKLLNQLHETKIIEIDRLTKLYNGIITNQNELISQYRKEIEYLRQKVKEYREKYEK